MTEPRTFLDGRVTLHAADCREVLRDMEDNSVDSVVTDPPYCLTSITKRFGGKNSSPAQHGKDGAFARASRGFMQKAWDNDVAFHSELWAEVLRVLKPGGYIMAFSSCRTYHRMACAIEDVGFITHPFFAWCFGSGFPKAHSVSKQIDKAARRDYVRAAIDLGMVAPKNIYDWTKAEHSPSDKWWNEFKKFLSPEQWGAIERKVIGVSMNGIGGGNSLYCFNTEYNITAPATDAAREWDGWFYGTQSLKPAIEPVYFGQKPFERGLNGAQNVQKWGVGAINVAACKIPCGDKSQFPAGVISDTELVFGNGDGRYSDRPRSADSDTSSRWPANLIHDGSDEVLACFPESKSPVPYVRKSGSGSKQIYGEYETRDGGINQSLGDSGSAARFFYTAKADKDDRLGSSHPTIKPLDLIQYLVRLVTPKNGTCLDLFAGTGTAGEACFREGFRAILIEREDEYIADIERRMGLVMEGPVTRANAGMKARGRPRDDGPLFGGSEEALRQPRPIGCLRNGAEGPFGKDADLLDVKIELAKIANATGYDVEVRFTKPKDEAAK